jgi:hypothetical protein
MCHFIGTPSVECCSKSSFFHMDNDMSQTYLQFLMLHACLCTIFFVFCYTSWRFYAFSGTNLLTRCHSASSLFSAIFVFQKSYTGNILGIGQKKSQSSYFSWHETESKAEMEGGGRGRPHTPWHGPPHGHAGAWCGPLVHLLTLPFHLYILLNEKTQRARSIF